MALHIYPVTIRSVSPPIQALLSRPTTEFRCTHTVIYFHALNGTRNQIFQDRYLEFATAIQELGCNLLSIELPDHGERRTDKELPAIQNILKHIGSEKNNPFVKVIEDIQKTIDFIVEKQITRPGEIAVAGMAWGATNALYALRRERRIRCGVLLLPVCKIASLVEFRPLAGNPIVAQYEPLIYTENVAPKPLLMVTGEKDIRANPRYAHDLYFKLQAEYQNAQVPQNLAYNMLLGVGHAYDSQMTDLTIEWLKKHLINEEGGPSLLG